MEPVGESHLEDDDLFETISPDASPFRDGSDVERELTPVAIGIDEDDDNGFEEISSEEEPYLSDGDNGIGLVRLPFHFVSFYYLVPHLCIDRPASRGRNGKQMAVTSPLS